MVGSAFKAAIEDLGPSVLTLPSHELDTAPALLGAVSSSCLPAREVSHCGATFTAPPLAIHADGPHCGQSIKLRSFSGAVELEDVFDAALGWLNQPAAQAAARQRQRDPAANDE